ncbi:MAG: DUF917 family protein [Synergistaceae bacterium]|jgi:DUF917 family protein|nr:DUF917 family protein [Synergistaceae bacterium]
MAETIITEELAAAAILGGAVLGGGGGGGMTKGRANAKEALVSGKLRLVDVDDVPPETILVTGSAVGAPAAKEAQALPKDYARVVELLSENGCPKPGGFIPNECGGSSITNGWVPAALMGLPLVDALCNGRAHPTGTMGSMGLHKNPEYVSQQAAAGGNPQKGLYLELYVSGKLDAVAPLIRAAADRAGGLVAVARNPVKASYAKRYGAPGALRQAIKLGQKIKVAKTPQAMVEAAAEFLGGQVVARGSVSELELTTRGGFDSGRVVIGSFETTFWNEFMTLEQNGKRLGTFPDLIMTFDALNGLPVTTAELKKEQNVFLLLVSKSRLILGEGMRCEDLLKTIEPIVGKKILDFDSKPLAFS